MILQNSSKQTCKPTPHTKLQTMLVTTIQIGADVRQAILKMEIPTFPTPTAPPHGADAGVVRKWEKVLMGFIKIFLRQT